MAAIAAIFSAVKFEITRRALIDSLPSQFQGHIESRCALSVYALERSTPLPLQTEYMKSLWGGCAAFLCVAFSFFCGGQPGIWRVCLHSHLDDQVTEKIPGELQASGGATI